MNLRRSFVALAICAILAHGLGIAWAVPMMPAPAEAPMPCHGEMAKQKPSMPCCPEGHCDCAVFCAALAMALEVTPVAPEFGRDRMPRVAEPVIALAPHRFTPLRPPITPLA